MRKTGHGINHHNLLERKLRRCGQFHPQISMGTTVSEGYLRKEVTGRGRHLKGGGMKSRVPRRGVLSLKCLLQGAQCKLSQCPPTTHSPASNSTERLCQLSSHAGWEVGSLMGHPPAGHYLNSPIQNVSSRHFIFQKPRICKSTSERELEVCRGKSPCPAFG